jgi:hypothetical protein
LGNNRIKACPGSDGLDDSKDKAGGFSLVVAFLRGAFFAWVVFLLIVLAGRSCT